MLVRLNIFSYVYWFILFPLLNIVFFICILHFSLVLFIFYLFLIYLFIYLYFFFIIYLFISYVYWFILFPLLNIVFSYAFFTFLLCYLFFLIDSLHILDTVLSVICYTCLLLIYTLSSSSVIFNHTKFLFVVIVSNPFSWFMLHMLVLEILSHPSNIKNVSYFF